MLHEVRYVSQNNFILEFIIVLSWSVQTVHKKIPGTGWLMKNRPLILTVAEAGSLRSRCRFGGQWGSASRFTGLGLFIATSQGGRGKGDLSGVSFIRALIPFIW